jgi:Sortase domain
VEGVRREVRRWPRRLAAASVLVLTASGAPPAGRQVPSAATPPRVQVDASAASPVPSGAARLAAHETPPPTLAPPPAPPPAPPAVPLVDAQAAIPSRVHIPRLGIDAPVIPLGLTASGALRAPAKTSETGWFTEGPEPGEQGPAVIAGHLDSLTGPAVFYRLRELTAGDVISVDRADQSRVDFIVSRVEQHAKGAFPTDAVYGATPLSELRLITCGGAFNRSTGHYLDNVIVFASRAPEAAPG